MKSLLRFAMLLTALCGCGLAWAGPGAHGPGGEHLDRPAPVLSAGQSVPRAEAKSESFELVARVEAGMLSILIDHYDTNEPVLDATVEVESGPIKSKAEFRREQGDYAISSPNLLKRLATPGSHPLVFTVTTPKDSDLLEGTLVVAAAGGEAHAHSYGSIAAWIAGALVPVSAAALYIRARRGKGGIR
jgi:hypothetical protein